MIDNKTSETLNFEKHPTITFTLTDKQINIARSSLVANGTLTMCCVTRPVELDLIYKVLSAGDLQISGTHRLVMSDFKMEPPTAMTGTIKVVMKSLSVLISYFQMRRNTL